MSLVVTHAFVSGAADGANASVMRPSDWGSVAGGSKVTHVISGGVPADVGLANVEDTALSTWGGSANLTLMTVHDRGGQVYNVQAYGATGLGVVDESTAVQAAITAALAANGGVILFPAGRYRINAQLLIPNDGASPAPHQKPLRFVGVGSHWAGIASPILGESVLDLRYAGTIGKIVTFGLGVLDFDRLTLTNGGSDSLPFVYTTNTTLHVEGCAFIGATAASPLQDAIVLGGHTLTTTGDATGHFQGYGTIIAGNYFDYIHRGVLLQVDANAVVIRDNAWWTNCGGSAAIEDWNDPSYQNEGLFTSGNLIEMNNYTYGIALYRTGGATLLGDMFYDGATFTAYYFFNSVANALPNLVVPGFYAAATAAKLAAGAGCPAFLQATAAGTVSCLDGTGAFTNAVLKTGRLEVHGPRLELYAANGDDVAGFYNSSAHVVKLIAAQADGSLVIGDSAANAVLVFANPDGTFTFQNMKPTTGYTYWQTQGGAGQGAIPLGRWYSHAGVLGTIVNADGSFTFNLLTTLANVAATGAFGCNNATPQTPVASGGALAAYGAGANGFDTAGHASALYALVVAMRAALVANGIMS
jgi:hypothetical protein